MDPTNNFLPAAKDQWTEAIQQAPWFDPQLHYLVTVDDDNGNVAELVFMGRTRESCNDALAYAFTIADELGPDHSPGLRHNGRNLSFVLQ